MGSERDRLLTTRTANTLSDERPPASRSLPIPTPTFSVVIPVLATPETLARCLSALEQLARPTGGYEIVVVDDGSPTPLAATVAAFSGRLDVRMHRQVRAGPAAARNAGAALARGRFLAFTDCDCLPPPDWLVRLEEGFTRAPTSMLVGRTVNAAVGNPHSATSMLILDAVHAFYNRDVDDARFGATSNLAVPAAPFRALGGFDAQRFAFASEDRDLTDRWRHAGHRISFLPNAPMLHADELTFRRFWRQNFGYGRGAWWYRQARKARASGEFRDDLKFHGTLPALFRNSLAGLPRRDGCHVAFLLAIWQLANAAGFLFEALRSGAFVTHVTRADRSYAYRCVDRSWLTGIIATRIAPRVDAWLPEGLSANAITWMSSALMWLFLAGLVVLPPQARTPLAPVWIALLWGYCILDHVDGCRARRRCSSSPFGEFLDHSLDAWHVSIAVIGVGLIANDAVSWAVVAVTVACACTATVAIWLEQKYRGEFILPVAGPVEAIIAIGLIFAAMMVPAAASALHSDMWRSSELTWAAGLLLLGGIGGLVTAVAGAQRCTELRMRLATWVLLAACILFTGSTTQVGWPMAGIAVTAMAADYSARVILSHLTSARAPWPDLLGPALLAGAALAPRFAAIGAPTLAIGWLIIRVVLTSRTGLALRATTDVA